jgi:hypothetical protein
MMSIRLALAGLILSTMGGCVSYGANYPSPATVTEITLKENDFKVVKSHMVGKAQCTYLFGAIPFDDPSIYSKALSQIRDQIQPHEGRPIQLVNYTEDSVDTNYFVFAVRRITITADAIEFTK